MMRVALAWLLALATGGIGEGEPAQVAQVRVFVPPAILFQVANVSVETFASAPVTVSFDTATLEPGQALRISVRADGDLTLPGGPAIPATNISWTTSNVTNGVGLNGSMSKTVYTPIYESNAGATSGRVDLTWKLAAPGGVRAGTREAALRWRLEAITP